MQDVYSEMANRAPSVLNQEFAMIMFFVTTPGEQQIEEMKGSQEAAVIVLGLDDAHRLQLQLEPSAHEQTLGFLGKGTQPFTVKMSFASCPPFLVVVELYGHALGASEAHDDLNVQRRRGRAVQTNGKLRNVQNHAHSAIKRTKRLVAVLVTVDPKVHDEILAALYEVMITAVLRALTPSSLRD